MAKSMQQRYMAVISLMGQGIGDLPRKVTDEASVGTWVMVVHGTVSQAKLMRNLRGRRNQGTCHVYSTSPLPPIG